MSILGTFTIGTINNPVYHTSLGPTILKTNLVNAMATMESCNQIFHTGKYGQKSLLYGEDSFQIPEFLCVLINLTIFLTKGKKMSISITVKQARNLLITSTNALHLLLQHNKELDIISP
jgi:hypothetical protein